MAVLVEYDYHASHAALDPHTLTHVDATVMGLIADRFAQINTVQERGTQWLHPALLLGELFYPHSFQKFAVIFDDDIFRGPGADRAVIETLQPFSRPLLMLPL